MGHALLRPIEAGDFPLLFALRHDKELQSLLLTVLEDRTDVELMARIRRRQNQEIAIKVRSNMDMVESDLQSKWGFDECQF